ncbi:uncharacterized protein LOC110754989 [Prunus avium]|uniref:Uncharacterized protein LOC110754989 n=1 Tax=Prunus avium TaxID=42229 RepID=A0A6P5S498_PRUAV|nr:uncharacterized protein LOC110754989 [Prunus avium]
MSQSITSSRQLFLRQASSNRRQPLLRTQVSHSTARLAEVAGGTAAECAAVCCCCPCGLVNLLVLVIYKVPAGICRRVLKKKRRKRHAKKGLLQPRHCKCTCGFDGSELQFHQVGFDCGLEINDMTHKVADGESVDEDVLQLEKEMWDRFYSTGFWRSPSQREPSKVLPGI